MSADLVFPGEAVPVDRSEVWNAAELAEKRKNSTVAREFEVALPAELPSPARRELALQFARELVDEHGFVADVAVHAPSRRGDVRNFHAHILCTTRRYEAGDMTVKTRELDDKKTGKELVVKWRERWSMLVNDALAQHGIESRVDHRSLKARGVDREPGRHLGPSATGFERRTGKQSNVRIRHQEEAQARLDAAYAAQEVKEIDSEILILNDDLNTVLSAAETEKSRISRTLKCEPSERRQLSESLGSRARRPGRTRAEIERDVLEVQELPARRRLTLFMLEQERDSQRDALLEAERHLNEVQAMLDRRSFFEKLRGEHQELLDEAEQRVSRERDLLRQHEQRVKRAVDYLKSDSRVREKVERAVRSEALLSDLERTVDSVLSAELFAHAREHERREHEEKRSVLETSRPSPGAHVDAHQGGRKPRFSS